MEASHWYVDGAHHNTDIKRRQRAWGRGRGAMGEGEQLEGQIKDPPAFIHRNVMAHKGHSKV